MWQSADVTVSWCGCNNCNRNKIKQLWLLQLDWVCKTLIFIGFCLLTVDVFNRAGNSLICSSLICSLAHSLILLKSATMSDSLRLLKTNERLWANRSGCSEEMSNRERFAQVAQRKWAIWVNHSFCSRKMSEWTICSKNFVYKKI